MSIPNDGIMLATNAGVETMLARWKSPPPLDVPAEVAADMEKMDFVLYLPELPGGIAENAAKNDVHIPVQQVWLDAMKAPGAYVLSGTANTSSQKEAKLLTLVLRLGIVAWMRTQNGPHSSERLATISVSAVGSQVKLSGMRVGEDELFPLFLDILKSIAPPAESPAVEGAPS
jgi:hypothetical protein